MNKKRNNNNKVIPTWRVTAWLPPPLYSIVYLYSLKVLLSTSIPRGGGGGREERAGHWTRLPIVNCRTCPRIMAWMQLLHFVILLWPGYKVGCPVATGTTWQGDRTKYGKKRRVPWEPCKCTRGNRYIQRSALYFSTAPHPPVHLSSPLSSTLYPRHGRL